MSVKSRLDKAFGNVPVLPLTDHSRIVLFSDCHRGTGNANDNFMKNQNLYFAALNHYYRKGFTYIELGDGDELWENRCLCKIMDIHSNVFWLLSKFFQESRLFLLYGNHDIVKRKPRFARCHFQSYFDQRSQCQAPLFPDMPFYSGLILRDEGHKKDVYLTHGHQADALNSTFWKVSQFLVRYVWKPLEAFGVQDPTSAAKNNMRKRRTEQRLSRYARRRGIILVTGHTHRPMLDHSDSSYFNTGSCVHPRCITCIEIEHRCLTLVKWTLMTRPDMSLYVGREVLSGPLCIKDIT